MELISNYSQPEFYRFSRDSIELANFVASYLKELNLSVVKGADFCAGCGVILLEIMQKSQVRFESVDFYELQKEYLKHLETNINVLKDHFNETIFNIHQENLLQTQLIGEFDLIVMNPPYFNANHSRSSVNKNTRLCREYQDTELTGLIRCAHSALKKGGHLFFVCRETNDLTSEFANLEFKDLIRLELKSDKFSIYSLLRA